MEFNLTEYRIYNYQWIGLFYGDKNVEAKICRFQTFLDNMAMFTEDNDEWKHFKYWLSSSNLH